MEDKLCTIEQVAEKLLVSDRTVRNWLVAGTLRGIKIGKLWRIYESDLKAFLERAAGGGDA